MSRKVPITKYGAMRTSGTTPSISIYGAVTILPGSKIKTITRLEPVIPSSGMGLVVIDRDPAPANYLEGTFLDDQSRRPTSNN